MRLLLALWKIVKQVVLIVLAIVVVLLAIFLWPIIAIFDDFNDDEEDYYGRY